MQHVVFLVLVGWGVEERNLPPFLLFNQNSVIMLLAFYAVDNSQHYGRHEFDCIYDKPSEIKKNAE